MGTTGGRNTPQQPAVHIESVVVAFLKARKRKGTPNSHPARECRVQEKGRGVASGSCTAGSRRHYPKKYWAVAVRCIVASKCRL